LGVSAYTFDESFRCDDVKVMDGIFCQSQEMIDRSNRFSEAVIIDATYNTSDRPMPLICAYGVSNLGGYPLKPFPMAFAWVSCEREHLYHWFLQLLKNSAPVLASKSTVFVTDKCMFLYFTYVGLMQDGFTSRHNHTHPDFNVKTHDACFWDFY
jgi:hypothetical protein